MSIRRADWVKCKSDTSPHPTVGSVKRISKDGKWADVDWGSWTKRMLTKHLVPLHTIETPKWTITDWKRKQELEAEANVQL